MNQYLDAAIKAARAASALVRENFGRPLKVNVEEAHDIKLELDVRGSVATLQEWSDMLGQCSLRHRFPICSSGGNSNRKSSFWRLVGICVFPCRTYTEQSCSPSEVCTPITSRCGVGSSGMPQKGNDVRALG